MHESNETITEEVEKKFYHEKEGAAKNQSQVGERKNCKEKGIVE